MNRTIVGLAVCLAATVAAHADYTSFFAAPAIPHAPRHHLCFKAPSAPAIDGRLDDAAWQAAAWTEDFGDIEGSPKAVPRYRTRVRLLWDDQYFYVAAEMEEPDLWAMIETHDEDLHHENDLEIFFDPDGDTHLYAELDVNARGTTRDLLTVKPPRDGGPMAPAWEIAGLKCAVACDGTLNDPSDRDRGWTVEAAIPWRVLAPTAGSMAPPVDGDRWQVNFCRAEWTLDTVNGAYAKRTVPGSKREMPAANWTWTPQGLIDMNYPEMWGVVQFSSYQVDAPEAAKVAYQPDPNETRLWGLRQVYYAQRELLAQRQRYSGDRLELARVVRQLDPVRSAMKTEVVLPVPAEVKTTQTGYEATVAGAGVGQTLHLRDDGRSWITPR